MSEGTLTQIIVQCDRPPFSGFANPILLTILNSAKVEKGSTKVSEKFPILFPTTAT